MSFASTHKTRENEGTDADFIPSFALFIDIDGPILELTEAPHHVRVPPALLSDLVTLRRRLGGAVALLTGRTIRETDRLLRLEEFDIVGVYGAELRFGDCIARMSPEMPELLQRVALRIQGLSRIHEGCVFEDKGAGFSVSWSRAPHLEFIILDHVKEAALALGPSYRTLRRRASIEVLPVGAVKSGAIARLMCHPPYSGRIPIFIGADATDEAGFELVNIAGGITMKVGDHRTSATHQLACMAEAQKLISSWANGSPFGRI